MYDVLRQYRKKYDPGQPRVCVDEKLQQLLGTPRGEKPVREGKPKRQDYEYARKGTVNHFVALESKGNRRTIRITDHRAGTDFAKFVKFLVMHVYKKADKVHLILDNLNTHIPEVLEEQYGKQQAEKILKRICWHYTPKHASCSIKRKSRLVS